MAFSYEESLFADPARSALHVAGMIAPRVSEALYPMKAMTAWHYKNHIKGITGRWMDDSLTGVTRGSYHRLTHGHHLFEDGLTVLRHPQWKFGQFLHHLGMDSLTKRGIPNPLLPTRYSQPATPKIIGGSHDEFGPLKILCERTAER